MKIAEPGTVIHNTHVAGDIIPALLFKLEELESKFAIQINNELIGFGFSYSMCGVAFGPEQEWPSEFTEDDKSYMIEKLVDKLDQHSPPNHYFGLHSANTSDYGFWPIEKESDE